MASTAYYAQILQAAQATWARRHTCVPRHPKVRETLVAWRYGVGRGCGKTTVASPRNNGSPRRTRMKSSWVRSMSTRL